MEKKEEFEQIIKSYLQTLFENVSKHFENLSYQFRTDIIDQNNIFISFGFGLIINNSIEILIHISQQNKNFLLNVKIELHNTDNLKNSKIDDLEKLEINNNLSNLDKLKNFLLTNENMIIELLSVVKIKTPKTIINSINIQINNLFQKLKLKLPEIKGKIGSITSGENRESILNSFYLDKSDKIVFLDIFIK